MNNYPSRKFSIKLFIYHSIKQHLCSKRRSLSPERIKEHFPLRHLTDVHQASHPTCWLFSSLFSLPSPNSKPSQIRLNRIKNGYFPDENFQAVRNNKFDSTRHVQKRIDNMTNTQTINATTSIHQFFTNLNYTNVNLTLRLKKKFELTRIAMSLCQLPEQAHLSFYKSSNGGKTLTALHHFSPSCSSILAREPASKHPVQTLRVLCSAWPSRHNCTNDGSRDRPKSEKYEYKLFKYRADEWVKFEGSKKTAINKTDLAWINEIQTGFYADAAKENSFKECKFEKSLEDMKTMSYHRCCRVGGKGVKICHKFHSKPSKRFNRTRMRNKGPFNSQSKSLKKTQKQKAWNGKVWLNRRLGNHTLPTYNLFNWKNKHKNKKLNKCKDLRVSFDFPKHGIPGGSNNPLMRDWVTASEIVVAVYFFENLDQIHQSLREFEKFHHPTSPSSFLEASLPPLKKSMHETRYRKEMNEIGRIK